ncbi:MAG: biotin/lipoate A/B protein ligase family protein [Ignavibacteriales bacterium]
MKWRFINSGTADGYTNMAVDEAIMNCYIKGESKPTLRIYGWDPPTVSLGYFQKINKAVNIDACKELGIDIVRRLTGGRAVLHEHEITYSIIIGEDYPDMPESVVQSYKFLCRGITEGLKLAGANVMMESGKKNLRENATQACFDSPSTYEIVYKGKKLVGSAQARRKGVILQHGSILIKIDLEKQIKVLGSKLQNDRLKEIFENKVITISDIINEDINRDKLINNILSGFEQALNIEFISQGLAGAEIIMAQQLSNVYKTY